MEIFDNVYFNTLGLTLLHALWQGILIGVFYLLAKQLFILKDANFRFRLIAVSLFSQLLLSTSTFFIILASISDSTGISAIAIRQFSFTTGENPYATNWIAMLGIAWILGSVLLFFRLLAGYLEVNQIKKSSRSLDSKWRTLMMELKEKLQIDKGIQLLSAANAICPFTAGHFKPIIIFPLGLVNQLEYEEVEAILAHELAHIKFDDYLINLMFSFIEALFYFHPIVWWLSQEMNEVREERCDQLAIELLGNRIQYVKTLVRMQEVSQANYQTALSFSGHKNHFSKRIFKILQQPFPMKKSKNKLVGYLTVGFLASCLLISSVQANQSNQLSEENSSCSSNIINFNSEPITINIDQNKIVRKPNETIAFFTKKSKLNTGVLLDTIPEKNKKESYTFQYNTDGKRTKIKMINGEITFLKIDGKVIPESEYEDYRSEVEAIKNAVPPQPTSPPASKFPSKSNDGSMAPPPPAPNAPALPIKPKKQMAPTPPMPPTPPKHPDGLIPPTPPSPPSKDFQKEMESLIEDLSNIKFDLENKDFNMEAFSFNLDSLVVFNDRELKKFDGSSLHVNELSNALEELENNQIGRINEMLELREGELKELELQLEGQKSLIREEVQIHLKEMSDHLRLFEEQHEIQQEMMELNQEKMEEKMRDFQEIQEREIREKLKNLKDKAKDKSAKQKRKKKKN